jgi:hypothetical protein
LTRVQGGDFSPHPRRRLRQSASGTFRQHAQVARHAAEVLPVELREQFHAASFTFAHRLLDLTRLAEVKQKEDRAQRDAGD